MEKAAVNIRDLGFSYTHPLHTCFSGLSLQVTAGSRFGLFGPNGAGKTTLMGCMTGLLNYEEGSISLLGQEVRRFPKEIRKIIGLVPQDFAFYQELSPLENLEFFGALYGLSRDQVRRRSSELLELLGLTDVKDKAVHKFSGGMKRKVNLAIGVMHNPPLLFLDEPTVGVDIQTRRVILDYLKALNQQGTTLIYTSHQLSEAAELCNDMALIHHGRIIEHDQPGALLLKHGVDNLEALFIQLTGTHYKDSDV
jgi:ABC-2 type transport system ATP-binding protein